MAFERPLLPIRLFRPATGWQHQFLHRGLFRVDSIETANVEHYYIPAARTLAVGVRLNPAGLAERVMNPAVVELILGQSPFIT